MIEAPISTALDPERAKSIYATLPASAQAEVASLMSQGMKGRHAVARVMSEHKQNLARESVDAERLTTDPTAAERFGAAALGAADTATFGQAGRIRGALSALPGMAAGMSAGDAYDEGKGAVDAYENDERLNPSFKVGQSAAMLASAASPARGAVTAIEDLVGGGIANTKGSAIVEGAHALAKPLSKAAGDVKALALRAKGAAKELGRETLEGGGAPTRAGMLRRALKALTGNGGENTDIVEAVDAAPKPALPEWMSSLVGDEAVAQASGLNLARPPPAPKPVPRSPRAPKAAPAPAADAPSLATTTEPMPDARERALGDLVEQKVTPPSQFDPEFADAVVNGNMSTRQAVGATRGAAARASAPKTGAEMKEAVRELLRGNPALAKNASAKAAQIGKRLGISTADAKREINNIAMGR